MAGEGKGSGGTRSFTWWLLIFFICEIGIIAVAVQPEYMARIMYAEQLMYARHLGSEAEVVVRRRANSFYNDSFVKTGFRDATYNFMYGQWSEAERNNPQAQMDDRGLGNMSRRMVQSLWGAIYMAVYRCSGLFSWLPLLVPVIFAVLFDGIAEWRIRQWRFSYASQTIHSLGLSGITWVMSLALIVIVAPFSMTPWIAPLFIMSATMLAWMVSANMAKKF